MFDRADAILKLSLAIAVLCLGFGVGYYYGIFLPQQAEVVAKRTIDLEKSRIEREKQLNDQKLVKENEARSKYEICESAATFDYTNRWNTSCIRQHDADLTTKRNCLSNGSDASYCTSITVRPANNCSLPSSEAVSYDQGLKEAKQLCLDELKAGA